MRKFLLLIFLCLWQIDDVSAQTRSISGKVTSIEDGSVLPGVNVVIKGTTQGTVTDADGNYALSDVPENSVLIFSFIGLTTQEIEIAGRNLVDIQMSQDVTQLGEVVVTAQGIERSK